MAKKKNNNSRKALAVALGIMGVAGLSLASAAQLTVTADTEIAMGVATFAPCQLQSDPVNVSYGYNTDFEIDSVTITGIAAACDEEDIQFVIENLTGAEISGDGEVSGTSWTYSITNPSVPLTDNLGDVTVVIG